MLPLIPLTPILLHFAVMPEPVWNVFHAIKDSLDCVIISDMVDPAPEKDISEYRLVAAKLLSLVQAYFGIAQYEVRAMNYTLILVNMSNPSEKYMATRIETFSWQRNAWKSLGKYVYL